MLHTPLRMFLVMLAGWMNEQQRAVNAYLKEENRVLRELHGHKRLRFSDDQRRRLAARGKALGRRVLRETEPIVTPATILRWHRELTRYGIRTVIVIAPEGTGARVSRPPGQRTSTSTGSARSPSTWTGSSIDQ